MATERLAMLITANGTQAMSEFQRVGVAAETNLRAADTSSQRLSASLTRVGVGFVTMGGLALYGLAQAAQAADEERVATDKLNTAFANSPLLAGQSTDALIEQAQALQQSTVYADDATIGMQALLATYRLTSDEIQGLTPLVQDLASFWGMDLEQAAKAVGKAMQGNIGALQRQGIAIDEAAFATDRYGAVMAALRENAGGFAEQEGDSFAGQMEILKNTAGDLAEGIGAGAIPVFVTLAGGAQRVVDVLQRVNTASGGVLGQVATWGSVGLIAAGGMSMLAGQLLRLAPAISSAAQSVALFAMYHPALTGIAAAGVLAATAITLFGDESGIAEADVAALSRAMAEQNDIIGQNSRQWLESFIAGGDLSNADELTDAMAEAGLTIGDLESALANGGDEWERFIALVHEAAGVTEDTQEGIGTEGVAMARLNDALSDLSNGYEDAAGQMGVYADEASGAAGATTDNAISAEEAADAINALTQEIDDYVERVQGIEASRDSVQEAFQSLYESLLENGSAWRGDTEAARANREAMRGLVEQSAAYISTLVEQGASEGRIQRVKATTINRLREARRAGLLSADAFRELTDRINNVPGSVATNVTLHGAETAIQQLARIHQEALDAAAAINQISGSLAGGGSYNPPGPEASRAPRTRESAPRMRSTSRRTRSRPIPVYEVSR